jgi:UDP:flavonoid glycosyltransferase YjiC (YdhE family)
MTAEASQSPATPVRVLGVAGPSLAHLSRVLAIVRVLQQRGYQCYVATDHPGWVNLITPTGAIHESLPPLVWSKLRSGSLQLPAPQIRELVQQDLALLERVQPQIVLLDWRPSMRLAAAIHGIPVVAIANAHVTACYAGRLAAPERHPITRILGPGLSNQLMPMLMSFFFRQWARPYQQVAQEYRHNGWGDLREYVAGDTTLFPDLPLIAPTKPGHGEYIGPLIAADLPFESLPPLRDPVLYITLGSIQHLTVAREIVVKTVGFWPGSVVLSGGGSPDAWPASYHCVQYADPGALTRLGHRVVWLYHGGNGSSYQLLNMWVDYPDQFLGAVVLPMHVEQQWNAIALQRIKAVQAIGSLQRYQPAAAHMLQQLAPQVSHPAPPSRLVAEIQIYRNSAERGATHVQQQLAKHG